jgi:DNA topoisomerase VI subunit B
MTADPCLAAPAATVSRAAPTRRGYVVPVQTLARTTFEMSRATEYFNARELQAQTGQPRERFATVALKELIDNALDACESAGIAPRIMIEIAMAQAVMQITVADNGAGISPETVRRILNFATRTSDKAAYRSPTRGAQGNALKTVLGMPCALGIRETVLIEAQGVRHRILAWIDPAGELRLQHEEEAIPATPGTRITLPLPAAEQDRDPLFWAKAFAVFNPHASVKICAGDHAGLAYRPRTPAEIFTNPRSTFPTAGANTCRATPPLCGGIALRTSRA